MAREKSKVTIYDVADRAGVAISTVSRVLNDSPDVSERTRQRVIEATEKAAEAAVGLQGHGACVRPQSPGHEGQ